MQDAITTAVSVLLTQPEEIINDKDRVIATCLTKAIGAFVNINRIVLQVGQKEYTQSRREDIATELTRVLFYVGCLSYVADIEADVFDVDDLTRFSIEGMDDLVQQDKILCSIHAIKMLTEITDLIYRDNLLGDPSGESGADINADGGDEIPPTRGVTPTIQTLSPEIKEFLEGEEDENPIEQCIAEIFACVLIFADELSLDLEVVMSNVGTYEKL